MTGAIMSCIPCVSFRKENLLELGNRYRYIFEILIYEKSLKWNTLILIVCKSTLLHYFEPVALTCDSDI
jgi:hypothetical protein